MLDPGPRLRAALSRCPVPMGDPVATSACFERVSDVELPLPGRGQTLCRWRGLALVAAFDLGVAKLYESHTDALAILAELGGPPPPPGSRWAVWAAEAPDGRVRLQDGRFGGEKAWCSGAAAVTHALVTCTDPTGRRLLAAVELGQERRIRSTWVAQGMAGAGTARVCLDGLPGVVVGAPGSYLDRPGFWQGGAGVAACWHAGATALAASLPADPAAEVALLRLGELDLELAGCAALLREAAGWIDAHPQASAAPAATRVRSAAERAARAVLDTVTRGLGPGPLATDAALVARAADLAVFVRQHHGDRDLAALGAMPGAREGWLL
jgi:hypothetical protein